MSPFRPRPRRDESGIALLIVLLTITLLTIVVIEFTDTAEIETHVTLSARNALEATYLARSGVNLSEALLQFDPTPGSDGPQDVWAGPFPPLPAGDGTFAVRIRDEARFLNVNDMLSGGRIQRDRLAVFQRLFENLAIDPKILAAIVDWIDEEDDASERPYYFGLTPPIVVRNGPLMTFRELLLVRGMTPTILARLEPFVTVLPVQNEFKVNLNTAEPPVIAALSEELQSDPGMVKALLSVRATTPFSGRRDAFDAVPRLDAALPGPTKDFVDTDSAYFRIEAVGEIGDVRRGVVELVKRDGKRIQRITWAPSSTTLALTSQPPSDFLATLPLLGDS